MIYTRTSVRENYLTAGRNMPPKQNLKRALWQWNSTCCYNFETLGTLLHIIVQNFNKIAQHTAEMLLRFDHSAYMLLNLHCQQHIAVMHTIYTCWLNNGNVINILIASAFSSVMQM